jgi:hypothetical protein
MIFVFKPSYSGHNSILYYVVADFCRWFSFGDPWLEQSMSEFDTDGVHRLLLKAPLSFNPSSAIADSLWLVNHSEHKADCVSTPAPDATITAQTLRLVNS